MLGGTLGGLAGSGGAGMAGSGISDLIQKYGPDVVKNLVGNGQAPGGGGGMNWSNLFNGIGGAINNRDSERYVDDLLASRIGTADQLRTAGQQAAGAYQPFYATANNGIATSHIDPATGQVSFGLNQPYQTQRDGMFSAANGVMGQLRDFNPQTFAADRYGKMQELIAPQRNVAQQGLLQQLYAKGGYGLALNGQGADGTADATNPYIQSFVSANNQQDKQMAYDSLAQGESYMDNLIKRQQGLFSYGQGIDTAGAGSMGLSKDWSNQFMGDRRASANYNYGVNRDYATSVGGFNHQRRDQVDDKSHQPYTD